jgi:hypothetical protein
MIITWRPKHLTGEVNYVEVQDAADTPCRGQR